MADSAETLRTQYPLPAYNFQVEIDGETIGFSEVSGLSRSMESITYAESTTAPGKVGPNYFRMPGAGGEINITLTKGYVRQKSIKVFYDWISSAKGGVIDKKDITVRLCDENGDAVVSWIVLNAFPTSLSAPDFSATSTDVAIESMELVADSLSMEEAT
ncbi:MAG: phage tail protein [Verrucomicrobiota bacterium]